MTKKLTVTNYNGIEVVDSREVAAVIGKRHDHLIRDIRSYIDIMEKSGDPKVGESSEKESEEPTERKIALSENTDSTERKIAPVANNAPKIEGVANNGRKIAPVVDNALKIEPSDFFIESSYQDDKQQTRPCYLLTKKGCDMVANKLTGKKGILFTAAYVTAFEQMRKHILQSSPQWQQKRAESKLVRHDETDAIKDFVQYAISQGSTHADMYYMLYTKMTNKAVGLQSGQRDTATFKQLGGITLIESIIAETIEACMAQGMHYKDIYKVCEARANALYDVMYTDISKIQIPAPKPKKTRKKTQA